MLAIVCVFVATSLVTQQFVGDDEPQFSERERAIWLGLEGKTEDLVVARDDIRGVTGEWYDCTDPDDKGATKYRVNASGEVEVLGLTRSTGPGRADSDFCESSAGGWIASALALSTDKSDQLVVSRAYRELAHGSNADLDRVVDLRTKEYDIDGDPFAAEWVDIGTVGDTGYALSFVVRDPQQGTESVYYSFRFVRSVVEASLSIRVPPGTITETEAVEIAEAFDGKIAAEVSSVTVRHLNR